MRGAQLTLSVCPPTNGGALPGKQSSQTGRQAWYFNSGGNEYQRLAPAVRTELFQPAGAY